MTTEEGGTTPPPTAGMQSQTQSTGHTAKTPEFTSNSVPELKAHIQKLNEKIEAQDLKISLMAEKLKAQDTSAAKAGDTQISSPAEAGMGITDEPNFYLNDEKTDRFREALILFETERYGDSIAEFSKFTRDFKDHPLAGSAQYFVGESYFRQKELKLAITEFRTVLRNYSGSSHYLDSMRRLAECLDMENQSAEAMKYKQMLASQFSIFPAAQGIDSPASKPGALKAKEANQVLSPEEGNAP
jgi:TolA-binding protein